MHRRAWPWNGLISTEDLEPGATAVRPGAHLGDENSNVYE
jgi:hypothetical protein